MIDTDGKFYLGRIFDADSGRTGDTPLLYDPDDLTTHAVVVGMTGSGKTGLCIDLLEEAALNGVPALMIDPKGDITNALLHFPELSPADFEPWVNADEARREGQTIAQAAAEAAARWREGLQAWEIGPERMRALQDAAHFAVYSPGSDAGIPVSILATLKAPRIPWEGNREILLEKISGTVTAILGLVGLTDIDPVRSREHILLSNIFEDAWRQGRDLDLSELILQTQNPPFEKLGVFDVNTFFPEDDRFELAMLLNNILAAPSFQTWIEGQPLEIASLLYGPDGRPRHSVFYIAHLSEAERMFFVTLLFSAVETWMRSQAGSETLRALVYFDEIYGYLPPTANPPSKQPMLRMLKQARAFGVGLMLVTQNPVDVDYKALSNAGTWFIGKLQTDQDKQRLLDGLEGAASAMDRGEYDRLISNLGKRVFLLHNVHERTPVLFQTRWAMNYLTGPLTRAQIPALNQLVGAGLAAPARPDAPAADATAAAPARAPAEAPPGSAPAVPAPTEVATPEAEWMGSATRPAVPSGVEEYYLSQNLTLSQAAKQDRRELPAGTKRMGLLYRPVVLAQVEIRFFQRKYNLDYEMRRTALIHEPDRRGVARWEDHLVDQVDPRTLDRGSAPEARFGSLDLPLSDAKAMKSLERDFKDWGYRESVVTVRANETLKVYAGPEVSEADFRQLCAEAARKARDAEIQKTSTSFEKKVDALEKKLAREERELAEDQEELSQRKMEEWGTHAENVLGLFGKRRRRVTTSLSKRRMTQRAKADVEESLEAIDEFKEDIAELEADARAVIEEINTRWDAIAEEVSEIPVTPYKKDVLVELFGVAWFPYHLVDIEGRVVELTGYGVGG